MLGHGFRRVSVGATWPVSTGFAYPQGVSTLCCWLYDSGFGMENGFLVCGESNPFPTPNPLSYCNDYIDDFVRGFMPHCDNGRSTNFAANAFASISLTSSGLSSSSINISWLSCNRICPASWKMKTKIDVGLYSPYSTESRLYHRPTIGLHR